ncbi:MAG: hypothetical protein V3U89_04385 [Methylophilaceae bacterium]
MDQQRQEKAISAYVNFLEAKSVDVPAIELRTKFVKKLIVLLDDQFNREGYGKALQSILKIEENIERQQQMNFAREFYPFWIGDIKSIARTSESYGFDLSSTKFKALPASLEWPAIDKLSAESLDEQESKLLRDYSLNLQQQNLMEDAIQAKIKLAKIVLLRLRDIPIKNNVAYRMAVDVTLPLFNLEDIKQRFLEAVREFFYIWIEKADPTYSAKH